MNNINNKSNSNYSALPDRENEEEYSTKETLVLCYQALSKEIKMQAQYDIYTGELIPETIEDYYDQHETPLSLIEAFYTVLRLGKLPKNADYWIQECKQWQDNNTYVEEA